MNVLLCSQHKTIMADSLKGNIHHFRMTENGNFQLFHIKVKEH